MRLLLDTHALLWWLGANPTLSAKAHAAIAAPDSDVYVSAVTAWEIVIKKRLGKLKAPPALDREVAAHQFEPLPVTLAHALAVERLPDHHEDPFDRMLVAQAIVEDLVLITRDPNIRKYPVRIIEA
ncbi:MAG: PIN domain nuclease [Acidobacteria bacterium]|nr:MAG: PIN domain nuclease [Acidobacteriota bacterium]